MFTRQVVVAALASVSLAIGLGASSPTPQAPQATPGPAGVREAAWSPDSKRIAASWFDAIWTMAPDGREAKRLVPVANRPDLISERDPAWSSDGKSIAFAASSAGGFDLWIAPASGGAAKRVTSQPGDERWPSFTTDGRVVFSHREPGGIWQLFVTRADGGGSPTKLTTTDVAEWQARVSFDGKLLAFISDREPETDNDADVWVRSSLLPQASRRLEASV